MPLPLLIPLGVSVLAILAIQLFTAKVEHKEIAILGPIGSGKTRLINFMKDKSVPEPGSENSTYGQTAISDIVQDINGKKTSLAVFDISGDRSFRRAQKDVYDKAEVVLFLVRAHEINDPAHNHSEQSLRAAKQVRLWHTERKLGPKTIIVATHTDHCKKMSYEEQAFSFRKLPVVKELILTLGGTGQVSVVLGSLKTTEDATKLLKKITEEL